MAKSEVLRISSFSSLTWYFSQSTAEALGKHNQFENNLALGSSLSKTSGKLERKKNPGGQELCRLVLLSADFETMLVKSTSL